MAVALFFLHVSPAVAAYGADGIGDDQAERPATYAEAAAVEDRVDDDLLADPGVVGTGVAVDASGGAHVLVMVVDDAEAEQIPSSIDSVPTEVLVTGVLRILDCPSRTSFCDRPVPPGVSVGHPNITAGTLGALVKDSAGNRFALSNNHVFADGNAASIGDPILQPGPFDGGNISNPDHIVGHLSDYQPIAYCPSGNCAGAPANTIDAAIAAVDGTVQAENYCGWTPQSTTIASGSIPAGATLKKCGRTSGETLGTFVAAHVTAIVQFGQGPAVFVETILTTAMGNPGDSGSLIVDGQNRPVALLFAGSDSATLGIPIDPILTRFGVTIDDGSAPPPSNQPPQASFTVSCNELTCGFDASASSDSDGTITTYAWDFGDGGNGSGDKPVHTYTSGGNYTVSLVVTDDDGAKDSTSRTATPTNPPPPSNQPPQIDPDKEEGRRPCWPGICDSIGMVDAGGRWWLWSELASDAVIDTFFYGNPGDVAFMGDWDGDGVATPGLYRQSDGFVYLRNSNTQGNADVTFFFGNPGDIPLVGDFDNDGRDTVSIYRQSQGKVYIINELGKDGGGLGAAEYSFFFGNPGDSPFVGDFNGDGIDTVGLHRASTGFVYLRNSNTQGNADLSFFYGDPGDIIMAGDWDGDGDDTVAVYRPSTGRIYVNLENAAGNADYSLTVGSFARAVTYGRT